MIHPYSYFPRKMHQQIVTLFFSHLPLSTLWVCISKNTLSNRRYARNLARWDCLICRLRMDHAFGWKLTKLSPSNLEAIFFMLLSLHYVIWFGELWAMFCHLIILFLHRYLLGCWQLTSAYWIDIIVKDLILQLLHLQLFTANFFLINPFIIIK